jgi:nicotinamidase-related amidase
VATLELPALPAVAESIARINEVTNKARQASVPVILVSDAHTSAGNAAMSGIAQDSRRTIPPKSGRIERASRCR